MPCLGSFVNIETHTIPTLHVGCPESTLKQRVKTKAPHNRLRFSSFLPQISSPLLVLFHDATSNLLTWLHCRHDEPKAGKHSLAPFCLGCSNKMADKESNLFHNLSSNAKEFCYGQQNLEVSPSNVAVCASSAGWACWCCSRREQQSPEFNRLINNGLRFIISQHMERPIRTGKASTSISSL